MCATLMYFSNIHLKCTPILISLEHGQGVSKFHRGTWSQSTNHVENSKCFQVALFFFTLSCRVSPHDKVNDSMFLFLRWYCIAPKKKNLTLPCILSEKCIDLAIHGAFLIHHRYLMSHITEMLACSYRSFSFAYGRNTQYATVLKIFWFMMTQNDSIFLTQVLLNYTRKFLSFNLEQFLKQAWSSITPSLQRFRFC